MDILGSFILAITVGGLMYALTNLNFFSISTSIRDLKVYPFLLIFILFCPILVLVESRAIDPVLNPKYFKSKQMVAVLLLAFIVGVGMMGMVFVPQFGENVLKLKPGNGGYLVTLLAVFSGIAAPLSGKLLDKKGAKLVLLIGFLCNITGALFLGLVATKYLNFPTMLVGLAFMGFGVGFTMGAPLNYLVLQMVPENESASGLATMSLVRSIGVTISPSIMIGFIVNSGGKLQGSLMTLLSGSLSTLIPKGSGMPSGVSGGMSSSFSQMGKLFENLKTADVTTIVNMLEAIYRKILPPVAQAPALKSLEGMRLQIENVFQSTINKGYTNMFICSAIIAAIGFITCFLLKSHSKIITDTTHAE